MESGKPASTKCSGGVSIWRIGLEDIDSEMERFRDEAERLKGALAAKPQGDAPTKAQRRLNYVRERSVLAAGRERLAEERTSLIRQLREADGNSA